MPMAVGFVNTETMKRALGSCPCTATGEKIVEKRNVGQHQEEQAKTLLTKQVSVCINNGLITVNGPLVFLKGINHICQTINWTSN